MADISIANLPAFLGASVLSTDLAPFVDVADTSESPLGTTKRFTFQQLMGSYTGNVRINGTLFVGTPTLTGGTLYAQAADGQGYLLFVRPTGTAQWGWYGDPAGRLLLDNISLGTPAITVSPADSNVVFSGVVGVAGNLNLSAQCQLSIGNQIQWGGSTDAITVSPAATMRFYVGNVNAMTLTPSALAVNTGLSIGSLVVSSPVSVAPTINSSASAIFLAGSGPGSNVVLPGSFGLVYLAENASGAACLAAYAYHATDVGAVVAIIWERDGTVPATRFSAIPGDPNTINLRFSASNFQVVNLLGRNITLLAWNLAAGIL